MVDYVKAACRLTLFSQQTIRPRATLTSLCYAKNEVCLDTIFYQDILSGIRQHCSPKKLDKST